MRLIRTLDELRGQARLLGRQAETRDVELEDPSGRQPAGWEGLGGVCVPTMGALHEGHASLVRRAASLGRCVVWVFVNPTQFNDPRDFDRYPRALDADAELCRRAGCDVLFAPDVSTIFPRASASNPAPPLPEAATRPGLEDAHRPGHFAGVVRVVRRMFHLLGPDSAIFGEKDWQQLQVVRGFISRERPALRILGAPTVRAPDGLALSSRNALLTPGDRERALAIPRALAAGATQATPADAEAAMRLELSNLRVEYAVVRDARTLGPPIPGEPARALVAAWSGSVRLIDNAPWPEGP